MQKLLHSLKIDIYADGADINEIFNLNKLKYIKGFTTNPTLMRQFGVTNYKDFCLRLIKEVSNKPLSFEVFADDLSEMLYQAYQISSWGDNVYVKIPITNTLGKSTSSIIKELSNKNLNLNITAVFTLDQCNEIIESVNLDSNTIISIFAGRIADTGVDPLIIVKQSKKLVKNFKNIKILWASPRELLNLIHANSAGADIITLPYPMIKKLPNLGKDLDKFSLETVKMFYNDATLSNFKIN